MRGMLESSRKNPARRTITVESIRLLSHEVALVDGRYLQMAHEGGKDREMRTTLTVKRESGGWRIAAIRNMMPVGN